ncbi:unnamed protein product [Clonostachys rosea]|uniref:NYN domain-containing protein n=1 Tax=Bionectria ochroleuca TaxID=29856 RepID=A0ABY6UCT2_BIOOC|nr:unnamed protein product [Clonostachys rosea]
MSKSQHDGGGDGEPKGYIHVYIDNSNLWIQGQEMYAKVHNQPVPNPKWRFHFGKVKALLTRESQLSLDQFNYELKVNLYASTPPQVETVWTSMESEDVRVKIFPKSSITNREKEVDVRLAIDAVEKATEASYTGEHCVFMIVSGDRDLFQAVERIIKRGFEVHVWSWKNSLTKVYDQPRKGLHVNHFDEYLEEIGFEENNFKNRIRKIWHAMVVNGGNTAMGEIANSITRRTESISRLLAERKQRKSNFALETPVIWENAISLTVSMN